MNRSERRALRGIARATNRAAEPSGMTPGMFYGACVVLVALIVGFWWAVIAIGQAIAS